MLQTFDVTCMFKENIANPLFAGHTCMENDIVNLNKN